MFETRDAIVRREGRMILGSASLRIEPGRLTAICGPNGAGKSTLLAVLSGALTADTGEALLDGEPLAGIPSATLARRRAVMEQSAEAAPGFTSREIVEFGLDVAPGCQPSRARRLVESAMRETDCAHLAETRMEVLSGGEKQRVHLARALVQLDAPRHGETRTLMLDEPTASLDLRHQGVALQAARRRARAGVAVLVVLHDLALAAAFADRVVLMCEGRITDTGTPHEVLTPARLERAYGLPVHVARSAHGLSFHPDHGATMRPDLKESFACSSP